MVNRACDLAYLTKTTLETIEYLCEEPLGATLRDYLLSEFGKHGKRREVIKKQEIARRACKNDNPYCCGYCMPYRDDPLLEEIVDVIRGFRRGTIDISCDPRSYAYRIVESPESQEIPF